MGIGGISFGNAAHRPQTDAPPQIRPQTGAGSRLTSALLLIMQRTRCTADAALMPPEGVSWALMALHPAMPNTDRRRMHRRRIRPQAGG